MTLGEVEVSADDLDVLVTSRSQADTHPLFLLADPEATVPSSES